MLVNSTAAAAARQPLPDLGCLCGLTAATLALAARCEAQRQYRCPLLAGVARTAPVRATQLLRLSAGKKRSDPTDLCKIYPSAACCSIEAYCLPHLTLSLASRCSFSCASSCRSPRGPLCKALRATWQHAPAKALQKRRREHCLQLAESNRHEHAEPGASG